LRPLTATRHAARALLQAATLDHLLTEAAFSGPPTTREAPAYIRLPDYRIMTRPKTLKIRSEGKPGRHRFRVCNSGRTPLPYTLMFHAIPSMTMQSRQREIRRFPFPAVAPLIAVTPYSQCPEALHHYNQHPDPA